MNNSIELRAAKAKIEMDATAKLNELEKLPVDARNDGEAEVRRMLADADALESRAALHDEVEARSRTLNEADARRPIAGKAGSADSLEEKRSADFSRYLRGEVSEREYRAMSVGVDAKGGFTVPSRTLNTVQVALGEYGPMTDGANVTILSTSTGEDINYNVLDDRAGRAYIIAEGAEAPETDITLAQRSLGAKKYTSGKVYLSNELLQDSNIDVQALVVQALTARMDRTLNDHFTNGNGTTQPNGIITALNGSSANYITTAGAATVADELFKLQHKPVPAYRANAKWMFADDFLFQIRTLKNADGDYVWKAGLSETYGPTILGRQYVINPDMAVAAGGIAAVYGDLKGYTFRQVRDFSIKRSDELAMTSDQVVFVGFGRFDGDLTDLNSVRALKIKAA